MKNLFVLSAVSAASANAALAIGRGTNLGNTLEAGQEGQWQDHYAQQYFFTDFKAAGFQTVRIPVRWDQHVLENAPYTVNATFMARIQEVSGWCLDAGLNCIVNSHWDNWLDTNDTALFDSLLPRYAAIWEQVGATFKGAPPSLWFEAFNEPQHFSIDSLNKMLAAFYSALRPLHPTRLLILGWLNGMGASWIQEQNHTHWNDMIFNSSDPNLAVEVHSYDPWNVCGDPTQPWGQPGDLQNMKNLFGNLTAWSQAHGNMPLFIGESGCDRKQDTRLAWYRDFFDFCMNGVDGGPGQAGCLVWDDEGDFGIYNRTARTWNTSILQAIGL